MADPRTKEELLNVIEIAESENENYKEFKESLQDLRSRRIPRRSRQE